MHSTWHSGKKENQENKQILCWNIFSMESLALAFLSVRARKMIALSTRGVTIHKSHNWVRTSVFKSRFGMVFGTAVFIILFLLNYLIWFDSLNCIKQMPYTNEKTIKEKNTIKSRTYFHCGPHHNTSGQDKTLTECVINNKNLILKKEKKKRFFFFFPVRTALKRASNR